MSTPTIEIEYCVPCGHLPRAMDVQRSILERFGQRVEGVKHKTGEKGVFVIRMDDQPIYTKPEPFELDQVLQAIEGRVHAVQQ